MVSRNNQLGLLSLNDELSVKARSSGHLRQLNIPRRLYIGGYPATGSVYHPASGVTAGLIGAVQRVSIKFGDMGADAHFWAEETLIWRQADDTAHLAHLK